MTTFIDDAQRIWTLRADVNALERIRDSCGVDLTQLLDDQDVVAEITNSPKQFVTMLYAWLEPWIVERQVSPEDFGEKLYDCFDEAFDAALEEIPRFFPRHRRELVHRLFQKFLAAEAKGTAKAIEVLESQRVDALIDRALSQAEENGLAMVEARMNSPIPTDGGGESTSSPESSESTPDR